jgi:hypothetical protein
MPFPPVDTRAKRSATATHKATTGLASRDGAKSWPFANPVPSPPNDSKPIVPMCYSTNFVQDSPRHNSLNARVGHSRNNAQIAMYGPIAPALGRRVRVRVNCAKQSAVKANLAPVTTCNATLHTADSAIAHVRKATPAKKEPATARDNAQNARNQ